MKKTYLVVGGGFKGMIAAYLLREKNHDVTIVERAPFLGGIMYSGEWDGFYIDNGVHLFDSIPRNLGNIVEDVMDGDIVPIDFNYASVYNDITTPGLAIPDLVNIPEAQQQKILFEVVQCLTHEPSSQPDNAWQKMFELYGETAAGLLSDSMQHIYGIAARDAEADSLRQTAYHRLKFLPDDIALELKKHPLLDQRLAAKRAVVGKVDDFISMYPGHGGMRGFCTKMQARLAAMGVKFVFQKGVDKLHVFSGRKGILTLDDGNKLEADHIFWGNEHSLLANVWQGETSLDEKLHKTPMVVFYFKVKENYINNYTYFHQFTPDRYVFRSAAAGLYSRQCDAEGNSFISVECPVVIGSDFWNAPEKHAQFAWQECVDMGLLQPGAHYEGEPKIKKAPVTHRFPKQGYFTLCDQLEEKVEQTQGVIILPKKEAFTRREVMWAVEEAIERGADATENMLAYG